MVIIIVIVSTLVIATVGVSLLHRSRDRGSAFGHLTREDQITALKNRRSGAGGEGMRTDAQALGDVNTFRHNGGGSLGP